MSFEIISDKHSFPRHKHELCYHSNWKPCVSYRLPIFMVLLLSCAIQGESEFNSTEESLDSPFKLDNCRFRSETTCYDRMDEAGDDTGGVELVEDNFGYVPISKKEGERCNEIVRRFTMSNSNGMVVQIITYGATITSIKVPDVAGKIEDVVLGFDNLQGYLSKSNQYLGATVGRVANRIHGGTFILGCSVVELTRNLGNGNHLHGGFVGFDKVLWQSHVEGNKLTLTYLSKDEEEGYPGAVLAHVTFQLTQENELIIEMKATTTLPTPVNLASHSYFNLAGHASGAKGLLQHYITINADKYTAADANNIPTGEIKDVAGTHMDLRGRKSLKKALRALPGNGFDNNLCITNGTTGEMNFVARIEHPQSHRVLDIHSNQPGVQFYTGNFLPETDAPVQKKMIGKNGTSYTRWGGLCLETQNYPDAVHHRNFPDSILIPGKEYFHKVIYKFSIMQYEDAKYPNVTRVCS